MHLESLSTALLLSGCISHVAASPKVISLPLSRSARRAPLARRDPGAVTLQNRVQNAFYSVNVTVGTPPQSLLLDVDTGSSDIWFFNPQACAQAQCVDGTFDPTRSSTYSLLAEGTFNISYADQSGASGDFISDVIDLGNGLTVSNQTMGLATSAVDNMYGLFGIAYNTSEAGASAGYDSYPTIIDSLVLAGLIKSRSYSLWLNDLASSTGTLLIGGYDAEQYVAPLTVLPVLPDYDSVQAGQAQIASFTVELSMVALSTNGTGSATILQQNEYPIPVILDSGTTLTELPPDSFYQVAQYFGATYDNNAGAHIVNCDIASWTGTLDFGFGGEGGTVIQVPFAELAIRMDNVTDGKCQFGLELANDVPLLGDTFLRSAYVVYNLDADEIGIAQSAWDSKTSNIQEIGAGDDLASLISGARDDSDATLPSAAYDNLAELVAATTTANLKSTPATATVTGVTTSLSVVAVATDPARQTGSSAGAAAMQTAAMLLPVALPFAAAFL